METQHHFRNTEWLERIKEWYPLLHQKTHFLPPLYFKRRAYKTQKMSGLDILTPIGPSSATDLETPRDHSKHAQPTSPVSKTRAPPPQESDTRDDMAQERLLHCLRELADRQDHKEVMMVISKLGFGKYLNKASYAPAQDAILPILPRSPDLSQEYRQGDFDVLIIHSRHGLMIGEVKSVGANFDKLINKTVNKSNLIAQKLQQAIEQLNRADVVLKHLVSDINDLCVKVTKFIVMPYIASDLLKKTVYSSPPEVQQDLRRCLGVEDIAEALGLCLCADMMSDVGTPWSGMTAEVQDHLSGWWSRCLTETAAAQTKMTSAIYEELVSRFCGPATTVEIYCVTSPRLEIRTESEGISETGKRMARLVLCPEQVDILNKSPPRIFLNGPPGAGKTVVLLLQGLSWLAKHYVVHVVSTYHESIATAILIQHQMQKTPNPPNDDPSVRLHIFDFEKNPEDIITAANLLSEIFHTEQVAQAAKSEQEMGNGSTLHTTGNGSIAYNSQPEVQSSENARGPICVLVDEAGPYVSYSISEEKRVQPFTEFCDKLIENVGLQAVHLWAAAVLPKVRPECLEEVVLTVPLRTPPVVTREVSTSWQMKDEHVPAYCDTQYTTEVDGPPIKRIQHDPGLREHAGTYPYDCVQCGIELAQFLITELSIRENPHTLHFSDVIVLCYDPREEQKDDNGQVLTSATGLVRGLRSLDVPVYVLEYGADIKAITDVTLAVHDKVTVTYWHNIRGLEKKVVVVTGHDLFGLDVSAKMNCISRCSSQLVWIQWDSPNTE